MVNSDQFRSAARLAVTNIVQYGDTDIFPFPFENHLLFDKFDDVVDLIEEYNAKFDEYLANYAPLNVNSMTPVSYTGFRWATQIDPIWNAYFLSCVLALGRHIEEARIPVSNDQVFSYRYNPNKKTGDLFDLDIGWSRFMSRSSVISEEFGFVIACDISEFYPRLGHHRLENALKQIAGDTIYPSRILDILSNFTGTKSFGLPIGGPASRLLSELTINQIDRLLLGYGITFTRFADDYHIFTSSREEAFKCIIYLSEKLFSNQGLSLQKSKTRIMTGAEFRATNPVAEVDDDDTLDKGRRHSVIQFLRLSLRFDPYSPTSTEDYQRLQEEIKKFDVVGILRSELAKSRVHTALSRKLLSAIKYLDQNVRDGAITSILENCDILYPVFSSVLMLIDNVFDELADRTKDIVVDQILSLFNNQSHIMKIDVHVCFAIRVLSHKNGPETEALLKQIYETHPSPLVRRDIIVVLARWGDWYWISDRKNKFRELSAPERRALIAASYILSDEGGHWRDHIRKELGPFEKMTMKWAGEKAGSGKWKVPL